MNQFLIRSDCHVIRSDENPASFLDSPAQASAHPCARPTPDRTDPTWVVDRDIQALRTAELPLRRRTRTRAEAIFVHEPGGGRLRRDYVPNTAHLQVSQFIDNFRKWREVLDEICAINTELLRRREDLG